MGDRPAGSMVKDKKTGERLVQLNLKSTPIGIRNTIVSEKKSHEKTKN